MTPRRRYDGLSASASATCATALAMTSTSGWTARGHIIKVFYRATISFPKFIHDLNKFSWIKSNKTIFRTHLHHSLEDARWANKTYAIKGRYYGENLRPLEERYDRSFALANELEAYGSINAHGIMMHDAQNAKSPKPKTFFQKNNPPRRGISLIIWNNSSYVSL